MTILTDSLAFLPPGPENVSAPPIGRLRSGWKVARSALTSPMCSPVTNWARSIQWVPMSEMARRFVWPSGSTRQL